MSDRLHKHCAREFLPRKGGKLRIGSLSDYRKIENEAVLDRSEGMFYIKLNFDGQEEFSNEWIRDISFESISSLDGPKESRRNLFSRGFRGRDCGGVISAIDDLERKTHADGKNRILGSIEIEFESSDAFLFCMSRGGEVGSVIHDAEYDASWSILRSEVKEFEYLLGECIIKHIEENGEGILRSTVGPFAAPGFYFPNAEEYPNYRYTVLTKSFDVEYTERAIDVHRESDIAVNDLKNMFERSAEIKTCEFRSEDEFRFIIRPVFGGGDGYFFLPNHCEPILIDCDPFLDFIRVEG